MAEGYLECPCCGDVGAEPDKDGWYYDGQSLTCGCVGMVCVEETDAAWINNFDEPCPCGASGVMVPHPECPADGERRSREGE